MRDMAELQTTLILIAVAGLLIPLGVWAIARSKRARRAMAPMAGMMLLLGAFFTADPPPRRQPRPRRLGRTRTSARGLEKKTTIVISLDL